jgi:hypothetical protein
MILLSTVEDAAIVFRDTYDTLLREPGWCDVVWFATPDAPVAISRRRYPA